jgi:hypothetical protein
MMDFENPQNMGLLSLGLGLLKSSGPSATPTTLGSAIGEAGQGGILAMQNAQKLKMAQDLQRAQIAQSDIRNSLLRSQIDETARKAKMAEELGRLRGGILGTAGTGPTAALGQGAAQGDLGPTVTNEARIQPGNPYGINMDGVQRYLAAGGDPKDVEAIRNLTPQGGMAKLNPKDFTPDSWESFMKTGNPVSLRAARKLENVNGVATDMYNVQPGQVLAQDLSKPFVLDSAGQVTPNKPLQDFQLSRAKAGASNVNVSTDKRFLGELASGAAKNIETSAENARASVNTLGTIGRVREGISGGRVIAGPGADARVFLSQVGSLLGVQGQNDAEKLNNTRGVLQGMAQLELDGAQQMKGQGQITEAERAIVKRAASGDINMTVGEIGVLMDTLEKVARGKIRQHNTTMEKLKKNPNASEIIPFFSVEEPPANGGFSIKRLP